MPIHARHPPLAGEPTAASSRRDPSLPKAWQTMCGGVQENDHLRRYGDETCVRWCPSEVIFTALLHDLTHVLAFRPDPRFAT